VQSAASAGGKRWPAVVVSINLPRPQRARRVLEFTSGGQPERLADHKIWVIRGNSWALRNSSSLIDEGFAVGRCATGRNPGLIIRHNPRLHAARLYRHDLAAGGVALGIRWIEGLCRSRSAYAVAGSSPDAGKNRSTGFDCVTFTVTVGFTPKLTRVLAEQSLPLSPAINVISTVLGAEPPTLF